MTFGNRVKKRRIQMRMNQKELSEASGLTQATISRIENGLIQQLKSEALKRLAIALGVSMDYLVGKTDRIRQANKDETFLILHLADSLQSVVLQSVVDSFRSLAITEES